MTFIEIKHVDNDHKILLLNHYHVMSIEYWTKIKMTRGDVNNYIADDARDLGMFHIIDNNEIDDYRLYSQNILLDNV